MASMMRTLLPAGILAALCLALAPPPAAARTHVYLQNNSLHPLQVSVMQGGPRLPADAWVPGPRIVGPGERRRIVSFNRDEGITDGRQFEFTEAVTLGGSSVALRQLLRGALINSRLWQSIEGHDWSNDRNTHVRSWRAGDTDFVIRYRAYLTPTDDNVEYVFQQQYRQLAAPANALNVLAWNIYMRPHPIRLNGQPQRTPLVPPVARGYDVIVFSEVFDDGVRDNLRRLLSVEYPHQTRIVGTDRGLEQDGGVMMVSRWPIEEQQFRLFEHRCAGSDCFADKGVLYARINKNGHRYHVFGTHTQAHTEYRVIRAVQIRGIRRFIDDRRIPADEPVLIAGDLNVDMRGHPDEYLEMLAALRATHPRPVGHPYTYDAATNDLQSGTGQAFLDYVLFSRDHLVPSVSFNEVRILRAEEEWKELATETARWDLSDHYAVYGYFSFPLRVGTVTATAAPVMPVAAAPPARAPRSKPQLVGQAAGVRPAPPAVATRVEAPAAPAGHYTYTAVTRARARQQGTVRADSLEWNCLLDRCTISGPWPVPGISACNALARQVGPIDYYGREGHALDKAQLDQCNRF